MEPKLKYPAKYLKSLYYNNDNESVYDYLISGGFSNNEALLFLEEGINKYPNMYSAYAGSLPEVTIKPNKKQTNDVVLTTYYPITSKYWATGHSRLDTPGGNFINITSDDPGYNLLLNNCSDATREALELATGKKMNPLFFTTPGDVRSFAENILGGKSFDNGNGSVLTFINLPQFLINKIAQYAKSLQNERRIVSKRKAEERRLKRLAKLGLYKNNNL